MEWNDSHKNPPSVGQKIYYFGENIGIGIGHYTYEDRWLKTKNGTDIPLCPHVFTNVTFGVVDACDAPFWLPYDEERAKSWCPIIPEKYKSLLLLDREQEAIEEVLNCPDLKKRHFDALRGLLERSDTKPMPKEKPADDLEHQHVDAVSLSKEEIQALIYAAGTIESQRKE